MKLRCIIVEDEPMARKGLAEDIKEIKFLEIMGIAENSSQAIELVSKQQIDLILLDIEMPKLSGLDLIKSLQEPPLIIITTAYPEYALVGYDLEVIDYLLKPIAFSRLLKACYKAKEFYELKKNASLTNKEKNEYCFIKCNGRYEKIFLCDLLFVEAADNYVAIHTALKSFLTYQTLKSMEAYLPDDNFIRVHKSFIVAIDRIDHIEGNEIHINKDTIPISRNFKKAVFERIASAKIFSR